MFALCFGDKTQLLLEDAEEIAYKIPSFDGHRLFVIVGVRLQ